jgi:spermidine synthase
VEAARRWLPTVQAGVFDDERVSLHIAPGEEWLQTQEATLDAILVDGTDPIGPGRALFEPAFFRSCRRALKPDGLLGLQAGSPFYFRDEVRMVGGHLREVFPQVRFYLGFVPTYPSGLWAYAMAGLTVPQPTLEDLRRRQRERRLTPCRYYTPEVHLSAFALPPFVQELLG